MSRRTGQLRTREALLGVVVVLAAIVLVVRLCQWLLLPTEQLPSLQTLPQAELDLPASATCDDRLAALRKRSSSSFLKVDSTSLIECPQTFDGMPVEYRGEAVGAALLRGDRAWLQLNDDVYALVIGPLPEHRQSVGGNAGIAVNVPAPVARAITAVGGAHHRGDLMTVQGTFRSRALDDGEAPSILVATVRDVRPGGEVVSPVSARRIVVAALLALTTGAVAFLRFRGGVANLGDALHRWARRRRRQRSRER